MDKIAILILAGGGSSRMKTPKQLLKIKEKYLLELVLEKAFLVQEKNIFCVLGNNSREILKKYPLKTLQLL
ncbi:NTP transferase domain-containing protein [Polaribacter batillariae]|uniref:NTP transferase domain-containing protein n=1 Tax=Polaribacter batillariae TaxID=2808900 RepID=UPI001FB135D0|nr:NTP transferase domain-containing protein [Polaribacter batillariae]